MLATRTEEYLVAKIGSVYIAASCRDVLNVYRQKIKLAYTHTNNPTFPGAALIANEVMSIVDLRSRVGLSPMNCEDVQNIIAFQTSMTSKQIVIVDKIIGMKTFKVDNLSRANKNVCNQFQNLDLLFPMVAISDESVIYHIIDTTYLDKLDPIADESGDLELF